MSVVQPGEVSMTSVADSRTARGVFNSWDTAAIKFFWLCMPFSVGFIACRMIRTDTNSGGGRERQVGEPAKAHGTVHHAGGRAGVVQKASEVVKVQQVSEHPKPGAQRVLLADVPVNQQPDFF